MPFQLTADRFQCGAILGKSRRREQSFFRFCRQCQPKNQVCRTVSAEDVFCRKAFGLRQLSAQFPAEWVGVAVCFRQCPDDGIFDPLRQAQRTDIRRKIQRIPAKLLPVADPVTAMY